MATIDTLCVLVEIKTVITSEGDTVPMIYRVVRSYEGRARAEEDLELLGCAKPDAFYRIDNIVHIER